jgi:hypothetical protein
MSTTTIPNRHTDTIQQGSPWLGVRVRMLDPAGDPYDPAPDYSAQCRTDTIDNSGVLLADCDISAADVDGWVAVTLTGAVTRDFPVREIYIDVDCQFPDADEPSTIMKITAVVEGEITNPDVP